MYRITRIIYVCKDGSLEQSNTAIEVPDLEKYRASLMGVKYAKINFVYSEIDDNGENRHDEDASQSEDSNQQERRGECAPAEE